MNRWSDEFIHNRTKFKKEKGATCYPKDQISERKINTVENIRQLNKTCYKISSGKISAEKKRNKKNSDIKSVDKIFDSQIRFCNR